MTVHVKVSKNRYRGAPIRSLREIAELVKERRAVVCTFPGWYYGRYAAMIKPAAWIINRNGSWINEQIERGSMFYCVREDEL